MEIPDKVVDAIANKLALKLGPKPAEPVVDPNDVEEGAFFDNESQQVIYTDPAVKAADEAEMECLKSLPKGVIHIKGKSGTTTINQSQESLEAIANWKRSRRQYRTRTVTR